MSLKEEVREALINDKAFACPIAMRVAWHASGTYSKEDGTGGSDGATMRFEPEISDEANAGLSIVRDMLHGVKKKHPELSEADLWTYAGAVSCQLMGGPEVPHRFGRTDDANGDNCPPNGRLPDASQGATHLRDVFGRMGFNDREIVVLSGGHTVGRCHITRSGYDGPWTSNPLTFDNQYFKNLMFLEWKVKDWDGKHQYTDVATESLAMLPTDMALKTDPVFKVYALEYAESEAAFRRDFSAAYAKLLALGCPHKAQPALPPSQPAVSAKQAASDKFRTACMHGSIGPVKRLAAKADVHEVEPRTGRSALHKAAFWGHVATIDFLCNALKLNPLQQDSNGDTPLHDAARFGHKSVVEMLVKHGAAALDVRNKDGMTPLEVAVEYSKPDIISLLRQSKL